MAELEVALRGRSACGVIHLARAGRHQIFLFRDVFFHFEVYIRRAAVGTGRKGNFVFALRLGIDTIETTITQTPTPLQRRNKRTALGGEGVVEPVGRAGYEAGHVATIAQRTEVGIDRTFDVGASVGRRQHGINAFYGGFDEASV